MAPDTFNVALPPGHTVWLFTAKLGVACTVTCVCAEAVQAPILPVTVYTVVLVGLTTTALDVAPVLQL